MRATICTFPGQWIFHVQVRALSGQPAGVSCFEYCHVKVWLNGLHDAPAAFANTAPEFPESEIQENRHCGVAPLVSHVTETSQNPGLVGVVMRATHGGENVGCADNVQDSPMRAGHPAAVTVAVKVAGTPRGQHGVMIPGDGTGGGGGGGLLQTGGLRRTIVFREKRLLTM